MPTFFVKKNDVKEKQWQVIDARGQVVGRLAAKISRILSGRAKTDYTPHVETGDGVIVINASEVVVTGNKAEAKIYKFYSGYPSGQREVTFEKIMKKDPTYALKHAVKGMLPKSRLGKRMITRLLIYAGSEHPHQAQKPKLCSVKELK
ncbi:MAG: 50S ribosomal protein L13 [Omnitrophica bacterium RIFCSPHIGHO2_02_FULL_51_18]|nr:MAG: 50S ribosomal protein L13 [Omnitrophica bacterium RIFCSPHIGHO2_02_FULL_51_18]